MLLMPCRSKKTWKNKNDDSRRKPFRFRRSPVKKKAAKPRPVNRNGRVTGSDSEGTGSRREGCKSTTDIDEISETNSVGLQDLRSSAGHQTTAPNDQKIDVERKRRALLAMTDWAGLHIPPLSDLHHQTPTSYKARLKGKAPAQMTTPERVIVTKPASEVETSSALGLDSSSSIHSDSRANHMNTFSLSHSSHDPIVSPTPTSPRIKKPASKVKVPSLSSKTGLGLNDPKTCSELGNSLRIKIDVKSNPRSLYHKNESIQKAPSDQHLSALSVPSKTDRREVFRPEVPLWIGRISEALGFSPPTAISEFEKQSAIEIESQHSPPSIKLHDTTPDLELFVKPENLARSHGRFKRGGRSEWESGTGENPLGRPRTRGKEEVDEDTKGGQERPESEDEAKERPEKTVDPGRVSRNLVTSKTNDQLLQTRHQTPDQGNRQSRNSDWRWRNLVGKSKNDQFDLLFQDRNDDERIF
ncbi:hypothetical protein PGT21_034584 [Puccinia graminis f. sp. tritici]|uniref:Uncharacterized protein n=1 Tax=Puccinia graminis f. sp. tritici TaxID=56615 RepID=A0A5B0QQX4_PUCGR|nr:hypothetical protein PGT21_034584 [Puccinia graminis f. sp. tritici]